MDVDKYIPDQVASVDRKLTGLDVSFDRKDYAAVLAGADAAAVKLMLPGHANQ